MIPSGEQIDHGEHVNPNNRQLSDRFISYIRRNCSKYPDALTPDEFSNLKKFRPRNPYGCLLGAFFAMLGVFLLIFSIIVVVDYFERTALGAPFDHHALYVLGLFGIPFVIVLLLMAVGKRRGKEYVKALESGDYAVYVCPYERKMWSYVQSASRRGGGVWNYYYVEIGGMAVAINLNGSEYESLPVPGEIKIAVVTTSKEDRFVFMK
jgi:hypothetical protein